MFRGNSFHTIDPKGRIIVPARFREIIKGNGGNGVMVTQMDNSLYAYTYERWRKIEEKVLSMAVSSKTMRRFKRIFIGGAYDCTCDKQGRFLIPAPLREYARIEREIVLVGVLDHFEIWSKEHWDNENQQLAEDLNDEEVRNEIAELGL